MNITSFLAYAGGIMGIVFVVVLGALGLYYRGSAWFKKEHRAGKEEQAIDFHSTVEILERRVSNLETDLAKVKKENTILRKNLRRYRERGNRYFALLTARCPLEVKGENGYCDYWHPLDQDAIREEIIKTIEDKMRDRDDNGDDENGNGEENGNGDI